MPDIPLVPDWMSLAKDAVLRAHAFVLINTPFTANSPGCDFELMLALARDDLPVYVVTTDQRLHVAVDERIQLLHGLEPDQIARALVAALAAAARVNRRVADV